MDPVIKVLCFPGERIGDQTKSFKAQRPVRGSEPSVDMEPAVGCR